MKVYFVRHGEAMDDIDDQYGGWFDADLAPKGVSKAQETGEKLKALDLKPEKVLTSPLKRAVEAAVVIAGILEIPVEVDVYLKERNTYGLLSGVNKMEAKKRYPELVEAYEKGEEVLGYEEYDFFLKRLKAATANLSRRKEKEVVVMTHGKFLGGLFDLMGRQAEKIEQNCLVEIDIDSDGKLTLGKMEGVEFKGA